MPHKNVNTVASPKSQPKERSDQHKSGSDQSKPKQLTEKKNDRSLSATPTNPANSANASILTLSLGPTLLQAFEQHSVKHSELGITSGATPLSASGQNAEVTSLPGQPTSLNEPTSENRTPAKQTAAPAKKQSII